MDIQNDLKNELYFQKSYCQGGKIFVNTLKVAGGLKGVHVKGHGNSQEGSLLPIGIMERFKEKVELKLLKER